MLGIVLSAFSWINKFNPHNPYKVGVIFVSTFTEKEI